jgi:uncharacterized protein DUF4255
MATPEAVAAVGLTLQALLADRVQHPNGGSSSVQINLGPPGPDRDPEGAVDEPRINLFLYRVLENGFLKNQDIPGRGHPAAYGNPPLSLDLHFLLTVFGSRASGTFFDETPAHQLLGSAMQVLHDNAIVTGSLVTRRPPAGRLILDPGLRDEFETIKVSLHPLGIEDLSNVWTALAMSYRLSVAYEVSVVQIESGRTRRHPRPVQEPPLAGPRVFAVPLQRPHLAAIGVRRLGDPPGVERTVPFARIGDTLVLHGNRLTGGGLVVRIGRLDLQVTSASAAGDVIEATIPDAVQADGTPIAPGDRLRPGTHTTSVMTVLPELPQAAIASGGLPLVLVPAITAANVAGRRLTVTGTRLLDGAAPAELLVGDTIVDRVAYLPGSTDTSVEVSLADTLPAFPAAARVSGPLAPFPALPGSFDLNVRVGTEGPHVVTLTSTPAGLTEAATAVQTAIRGATDAPGFNGVRVTATTRELILVAGDLMSPITVSPGTLADGLGLATASSARDVYLSGALRPFPSVTSGTPQVRVRIGATTAVAALPVVPTSLADAATALETSLRSANAAAAFAGARVATLGDQLCILPGAVGAMTIGPVPGVDETTATELELAAAYLVRARVRGVESIDEQTVDLP